MTNTKKKNEAHESMRCIMYGTVLSVDLSRHEHDSMNIEMGV